MELKGSRFRPGHIAYILIFALVTTVTAAWTVAFLVKRGGDAVIPDLIAKTVPEARFVLEQRGLGLQVRGVRYSDDLPTDTIVHQSIAPHERVRMGRTVAVYVSQGPRERVAPKVVGLRWEAAQTVLASSQLQGVIAARSCSDRQPAQQILAQNPLPGQTLLGDRVTLLLSNGPCGNRFVMGNLLGFLLEDILEIFDEKGFIVRKVSHEKDPTLPPGVITDFSPDLGSIVQPFDPLRLVVSAETQEEEGLDARETKARVVFFRIRSRPGLLRREAKVFVNREEAWGRIVNEVLLNPGQSEDRVVWLNPGAEVILEIDGKEIWRKIF